jgi:hypothetical protein
LIIQRVATASLEVDSKSIQINVATSKVAREQRHPNIPVRFAIAEKKRGRK